MHDRHVTSSTHASTPAPSKSGSNRSPRFAAPVTPDPVHDRRLSRSRVSNHPRPAPPLDHVASTSSPASLRPARARPPRRHPPPTSQYPERHRPRQHLPLRPHNVARDAISKSSPSPAQPSRLEAASFALARKRVGHGSSCSARQRQPAPVAAGSSLSWTSRSKLRTDLRTLELRLEHPGAWCANLKVHVPEDTIAARVRHRSGRSSSARPGTQFPSRFREGAETSQRTAAASPSAPTRFSFSLRAREGEGASLEPRASARRPDAASLNRLRAAPRKNSPRHTTRQLQHHRRLRGQPRQAAAARNQSCSGFSTRASSPAPPHSDTFAARTRAPRTVRPTPRSPRVTRPPRSLSHRSSDRTRTRLHTAAKLRKRCVIPRFRGELQLATFFPEEEGHGREAGDADGSRPGTGSGSRNRGRSQGYPRRSMRGSTSCRSTRSTRHASGYER